MKKLSCCLIVGLLCGCVKEPTPTPLPPIENQDVVVSFTGVGDNLIHSSIFKDALQEDGTYDFTSQFSGISSEIWNSDLAFINQETMIAGVELGLSGYPAFNSPSEIAQNLNELGFDLVNLATNHSLDRNLIGIEKTLAYFNEQKPMVHNGIYTSWEDYQKIPVIERKGMKFSFLSYTYGTNGIVSEYDYEVSYLDEDKIKTDIRKAKEISDVVIVSAHWGIENDFVPSESQKYYAQLFADCGANVVVGTHPHVIQPVEWVKGINGNETLVIYSLGNFMGGMLDVDNVIGGMIQFDFVKKENEPVEIQNVNFIPLVIHFEGNQANIMDERYHYKTYQLSDYSDELANKHVLNGYENQIVSIQKINETVENVIDSRYLN